MTKQEFVERVASKTDMSPEEALRAVDAFLETVTEMAKRGEDLAFTGFGKVSTGRQASRLDPMAAELRKAAEDLERSQAKLRTDLKRSRETLREIAAA